MIVALLLVALNAAPSPEECIASAKVAVTHGGKTYRLASDACREQFLSDPDRYSQLYDALLELRASGARVAAAPASAVPS